MKAFAQTALLLASAASAVATNANTVTFNSLDNTTRIVHFTPSPGSSEMDSVTVPGSDELLVEFEDGWQGNFYAVPDGDENIPGMLGEVKFQGWAGKTYFDVSAIVKPDDKDNVREMWPKSGSTPMSGCVAFPCDNAYYLPDDVQTKVTDETDLICTLGANGLSGYSNHTNHTNHSSHSSHSSHSDESKREEHLSVGRNYVMGKI